MEDVYIIQLLISVEVKKKRDWHKRRKNNKPYIVFKAQRVLSYNKN
ncbi:hypothetical protein EAVNVH72_00336 [Elizabethkingia anophelis]|nr:hypothetical protein EAVNVH72_00336 [Elizabethkingia anophelis]